MFGRQRPMPIYSQHSRYPVSYNQHLYSNSVLDRGMSQQNRAYPQSSYNPYFSGMPMNQPFNFNAGGPNGMAPMEPNWQGAVNGYGQNQHVSQLLFENPLQPQTENPYGGMYQQEMPYQNMNPYPQQAYLQKQPGNFQAVMNSFKNQEGNLDLNKMIDTAGQMMNAVTQVSSVVKGLGGFFKV